MVSWGGGMARGNGQPAVGNAADLTLTAPRRIAAGHRVVRAPSDSAKAGVSYPSLAAELVDRNHVQLTWIAAGALVAIVSMAGLARTMQPEVAASQEFPVVRAAIGISILASIAVILLERTGRLSAMALLHCGLVYEVLMAASISVLENAIPWSDHDFVRGASSITIWLIAFALLVPAPPWTAAFFSLAAAAMGPIGHYAMASMLKLPVAPANRLFIYYSPCFLTSAVAVLINLRILRLEWAASRAREMGSYQLTEMISRGGMGEVWKARHRLLKRDAAIKVIRPDILITQHVRDAEVLRKRFEQEARAIASLRSPHTVEIYDFGMTEDGGFYYVMELLEGFDLDTLVNTFGPQPPARVVHILRQACDSLEEAHRRSMVHRDIKPTNLFLCQLGTAYDFCKLLDFGLVKRLVSEDARLMTQQGAANGTPAFMAPEVAMGSAGIDCRVDLYGLGCVAYWLLTGHLLFDEPTPLATVIAHIQKPPVPPSHRTEVEIPPELERIVLSCLAKNPCERPDSAAALGRMLASCPGVTPWRSEDAEHWWRINAPKPDSPVSSDSVQPATSRQLVL